MTNLGVVGNTRLSLLFKENNLNKFISQFDLGFIVGFFEGEGCIGLYNKSYKEYNNKCNYGIFTCISNTNKNILNKIQRILQIGNIRLGKEKTIKSKTIYQFDLRVYEIKDFLETILPHLNIKKYQALIALEYLKDTTNCNNIKRSFGENGTRLSIDEEIYREILIEAMKLLNKKGPYIIKELEEIRKIKQYYDWYYEEYYSNLKESIIS